MLLSRRIDFLLTTALIIPIILSLVIFKHGSTYTIFLYSGILLNLLYKLWVNDLLNNQAIKNKKFIFSFVFLFLFSFMSFLVSDYPIDSIKMSLSVFIPSLVIIFLVMFTRDLSSSFFLVSKLFIILISLLSLYGIAILFLGQIEGEAIKIQYIEFGDFRISQNVAYSYIIDNYRIYSLTINPNSLGMWLEVSLPLTLLLLLLKKLPIISFILLFLVQSIALYYTFSDASIFLAALNVLAIASITNKYALNKVEIFLKFLMKYKYQLTVLLIVTGVLLYIFISNSKSFADFNFSNRKQIWVVLYKSFLENMFFGKGFGVSTISILNPAGIYYGAHNLYLALLAEIGLIGFFLFLLFIGYGLLLGFKNWFLSNCCEDKFVIQSLIILIISYLIHSFVEGVLFRFTPFHFFWFYFVVLVTVYKSVPKYEPYNESRKTSTGKRKRNKRKWIYRIKLRDNQPN